MIRLFRVYIPTGVLALLASETLLITFCYIFACFLFLDVDPSLFLLYDGGLLRIALVTISILLGLHFQDLYSRIYVKSRILLVQELCLVIGIAFVAQGLISYVSRDLRLPVRVMLPGSILVVLLVLLWRSLYSYYVLGVMGRERMLFVGGSPLIEEIVQYIETHPELGLAVTGHIDDGIPPGTMRSRFKVLGPIEDLVEIASQVRPSRIVVGMTERRSRMPVAALLELRFAGFIIEEAASTYETVCARVCTKELRPSQLIFSGELGPRPSSLAVHTIFNVAIAVIGAILASPLMLLSALAVRLSSPGPILYRQTRVGLDGRLFTVYKFRSMFADAEARTGAVWASKDDPRITKVGNVLRKIRFDELPQLFNVLAGDMAIVGPRPERPEFVKTLSEQIPYYNQRHCVKPGITGWAQVNHKYGDTMEDTIKKLEYDLYYIKNMSQALDWYIIFHTAKTMLLSRGAQ